MTTNTQWANFYQCEEELIKACADIDVHKFNELCNNGICKGYQYITRITRHINSKKEVSVPQLNQLKRLAKEVKKYHDSIQLIC